MEWSTAFRWPARPEAAADALPVPTSAQQRTRALRVGIVTDALVERDIEGHAAISNGGIGVYIYNLVRQLQLMPERLECVLLRMGPGRLDIYHNQRSQRVFLPRTLSRRAASIVGFSDASIVTQARLDLVHYPNQFGGAWLPARVRRVITLHDITPLLFPAHHPWTRSVANRFLLRRSLRAADAVIVDSANTRADALAHDLAPASRLTVVPLGAGEHFRTVTPTAEFARRYDLPSRFILNVGVLEPRKNHALLVEALRRLHAHGEAVGLVLVGRDGWRWKDPLAAPPLAHLRPWVRILRNVPDTDLPEFYSRAEVFAYPSLYEGFGLPVLEAMACGAPVIAARSSSLPEVVGDAALLADPTDPNEITAHLLAVLRDPVLRARLAARGQQRAREFSWQRTAEATLAVYESVCR